MERSIHAESEDTEINMKNVEHAVISSVFDSGSVYSVSLDGGFIVITTPRLDKPLRISLAAVDSIATDLGTEKEFGYYIQLPKRQKALPSAD